MTPASATQTKPAKRMKRAYVPPHRRRKRGGQPGNRNALKQGHFTRAARARRRTVHDLLAEIRFALAIARLQQALGRRRGEGVGEGPTTNGANLRRESEATAAAATGKCAAPCPQIAFPEKAGTISTGIAARAEAAVAIDPRLHRGGGFSRLCQKEDERGCLRPPPGHIPLAFRDRRPPAEGSR